MPSRIPLGVSDFREIREEGLDYVDKSALIRELIEDGSKVLLLPRPRRFGKTLNLSMLRYYFERCSEDRWPLFEGLAIARAGERYRAHFQRYPTISLTFKDLKARGWADCHAAVVEVLAALYRQHRDLLPGLPPDEAADFQSLMDKRASGALLERSLLDLTRHLHRHHGERVLVLVDEYDTPLNHAHSHGYYDDALGFFRNLLSAGLKDNPALHKGVLTGVFRIAKDNIFTGLNHLTVCGPLQRPFCAAFGFTQAEVEELLRRADLSARLQEVQRWYNGYLFGGGEVIYNPWSVLSFLKFQPELPQPYWADTSNNDLVRELLMDHGVASEQEWAGLLGGGSIERPITDQVVLRELPTTPDLLWSILLSTGYLKVLSLRQEQRTVLATLAIPNEEVRSIYETRFADWLKQGLGGDRERRAFLLALLAGDAEAVQRQLSAWLMRSASFHDTAQGQPERFYHGLVLGLLVSLGADHEVRSNPEAGYGRCDILITPRSPGKSGVVLELKVADARKRETLAGALRAAKEQLRERDYAAALRQQQQIGLIHELAIAWRGKDVRVERVDRPGTRKPPGTRSPSGKRRRPAARKRA